MLHEERSYLSNKTLDMKRAIDSLKEELEAVDWYNQRAEACKDKSLRDIIKHNANEEKEHAAMLMEWIRRNDKGFEEEMEKYVFADEEDILSIEEEE